MLTASARDHDDDDDGDEDEESGKKSGMLGIDEWTVSEGGSHTRSWMWEDAGPASGRSGRYLVDAKRGFLSGASW